MTEMNHGWVRAGLWSRGSKPLSPAGAPQQSQGAAMPGAAHFGLSAISTPIIPIGSQLFSDPAPRLSPAAGGARAGRDADKLLPWHNQFRHSVIFFFLVFFQHNEHKLTQSHKKIQ